MAFAELKRFLVDSPRLARTRSATELYSFAEPQSLHHLFKVACGLDSMVLGETEILGQLKTAYDLALQHRHTGARLNKAFQRAFHVAKHVRTRHQHPARQRVRGVGRGGTGGKNFQFARPNAKCSSSAPAKRARKPRARCSRAAQDTSSSPTARSNAPQRSPPNWADAPCLSTIGPAEFEKIDIAISSTAAPHHILDRAKLEPLMKRRRHRPLLLIDIAVPRDIDPDVNFLDNVYLYNVDDLQGIADDYLNLRREEIARCEKIIRRESRSRCWRRANFQPETRMNADETRDVVFFGFIRVHPCSSVVKLCLPKTPSSSARAAARSHWRRPT